MAGEESQSLQVSSYQHSRLDLEPKLGIMHPFQTTFKGKNIYTVARTIERVEKEDVC